MNIDVAKAIKELLYENDVVIIPGLGGFNASTAPSSVDYVKGVVTPPSRKLEFNPNLVINDGILVNHIQQSEVITSQEASQAIEKFVEELTSSLDRREIVDLPEIGRLYKDFEHKIRFMPEGANFDPTAFGLPAVQFKPVTRDKTAVAEQPATPGQRTPQKAAAAATGATTRSTGSTSGEPGWATTLLPWLIGLAVILLVVSMIMYFSGDSSSNQQAEEVVPTERLNVKPSSSEDDPDATGEEPVASGPGTNKDNDETGDNTGSAGNETGPTTPGTAPPPPSSVDAFIVIHSFGQQNNADKFMRELKQAGYAATSKRYKGLYRVGVEQAFGNQSEVEAMIRELGRKFNAKPVVVDY